jgi:hypothetical protein
MTSSSWWLLLGIRYDRRRSLAQEHVGYAETVSDPRSNMWIIEAE